MKIAAFFIPLTSTIMDSLAFQIFVKFIILVVGLEHFLCAAHGMYVVFIDIMFLYAIYIYLSCKYMLCFDHCEL